MRFKAFFLYIGLGAAFLAVSLWVFLSRGKSARAIGAKYKLGGMMLAAWALLSASTCSGPGPGPEVTCYEPVVEPTCYDMPVEMNIVSLENPVLTRGQECRLTVTAPSYESYLLHLLDEKENVLQEVRFTLEGDDTNLITIGFVPAADLPAGKATLRVLGCYEGGQNPLTDLSVTIE